MVTSLLQSWFGKRPAGDKIGVGSSCAGGGSSQAAAAAAAVPGSCQGDAEPAAVAGQAKERQESQDSGVDSGPASVCSGTLISTAPAGGNVTMMGEADKLKAAVASLETELKTKESHITALEAELRAMNRKMQSREAEISRQVIIHNMPI